ncbi:MAG: GGDEF domain-containing protein [Gemmatimonadota bacterium]
MAVKVTEEAMVGSSESDRVAPEERRAIAAASVLRAQLPTRLTVGVVVSVVQLFMLAWTTGWERATDVAATVAVILAAYCAGLALIHATRVKSMAIPACVTCVLALDLAFVFAMTGATSAPAHYDRALLGMIIIVHVANYFFGGQHAWRALQMGFAAHLALIYYAKVRHFPIDVPEELWTLALCAAGISVIVIHSTDVRRRLRSLVGLFEHAEEGDFTRAYDVAADSRPDGITRVGQAYNRVRTQLSSMVLTDPLTGCLNRRGFDQALAREAARATRAGGEFGLIAIDLDHFKSVNDTYGHLAGDVVLRDVGALLLASGRAGDVVARVGGEEFAILLPDTGVPGAYLFAARLCECVRSHRFVVDASAAVVSLTTSVGVAVGSPRGEPNFPAVLWSRADSALYAAKRADRDCVRAWGEDTEHSGEHEVIASPGSGLEATARREDSL